jgi:acyl-CoA dehydrogenase
MADRTFLDWPFFDDRHRAFAADLDAWADGTPAVNLHGDHDLDGDCRAILRALAEGGWLRNAVPDAG